jgi:hypothetical protein
MCSYLPGSPQFAVVPVFDSALCISIVAPRVLSLHRVRCAYLVVVRVRSVCRVFLPLC